MLHKCEGCRYKGEHQEMGFKAVGVCTKTNILPDAIAAYNETECRFAVEKQNKSDEFATLLKNAAQGALNAYTTNIVFGGKADQREENWIEALFYGMNAISLVEELQQQLEQVEKKLEAAIRDIPKTCGYCKFFNWDTRKCTNEMQCSCVGGTHNLWRWTGESE